jgi:hypothetical protein
MNDCRACCDSGFVSEQDHSHYCTDVKCSSRCPVEVQIPCPDCMALQYEVVRHE